MSKSVADIDPGQLERLNAGVVEATTLTECLAVDFATLMAHALPSMNAEAQRSMAAAAGSGISKRMALAGELILAQGPDMAGSLSSHTSDTVRGWACFVIGARADLGLAERLALIRPLADDSHFGVREWAWMAVRPHLAAELQPAIALLAGWTNDPSERVRRFASEALRPRGVWCAHIGVLKQQPELALPILEPLRADPATYVQLSVGNWLNDASKDQPDWVQVVCARWLAQSPVDATARISKRALRSVKS